ncbi:MAG TPA: hypothetical protein VMT47_11780 [Polyangia bacterium]|nr:hypothetical protein [Polyangia bacterium]
MPRSRPMPWADVLVGDVVLIRSPAEALFRVTSTLHTPRARSVCVRLRSLKGDRTAEYSGSGLDRVHVAYHDEAVPDAR